MTKKQIVHVLEEWESHFDTIDSLNTSLRSIFSHSPESLINNSIYKLFDSYTKILSKYIGDECEWLNWYCWENDMGSKKFDVKLKHWKKDKKITSLDDLADLIIEDNKLNK